VLASTVAGCQQLCSKLLTRRKASAPESRRIRMLGREPIFAMNNKQRTHRNCRGTSTLEFIVALPFLLLVMLVAVGLSFFGLFSWTTS
jgi:hypothetical protein